MKHIFLFICLFGVTRLHAQQAKAYETIHYIATLKNTHWKLEYADGYLAATKVKFKTQVFLPVSGTPENNGDLVLRSKTDKIILLNIKEEETPASTIYAKYEAKGQVVKLVFRQLK